MRVCIEQETDLCVELEYPNWLHFCPICGWMTIDPRTLIYKEGDTRWITLEEFNYIMNGPYQYIQNCSKYGEACFTESRECENCKEFKERERDIHE